MMEWIRNIFSKQKKLGIGDIKHEDTFDSCGKLILRKYLVPVGGLRTDLVKDLLKMYDNNYDRIVSEVVQENRDRAIDSILNDVEYIQMKIEDHPDYKFMKL